MYYNSKMTRRLSADIPVAQVMNGGIDGPEWVINQNEKMYELGGRRLDKRVYKTRQNLRQTLLRMMEERSFSKITVKDICETANTSRITFYNHYGDKYDLLDDVFNELEQELLERFQQLQKENNTADDLVICYQNLMDAILDIRDRYIKIYNLVKKLDDTEMVISYYRFITRSMADIESRYQNRIHLRYSGESLNAFFALGIWGFINKEEEQGKPAAEVRKGAHALIVDLVNSSLFAGISGTSG
ncbi:MAG TPA: TetR/AcrR family transcriptional regulator [Lachnospiraceae bacterium]|jgi:AcrR family transcriptional regulator|nr:TetR/AcrR family transcriptional regulator [Lachnospiraceae bacterium]